MPPVDVNQRLTLAEHRQFVVVLDDAWNLAQNIVSSTHIGEDAVLDRGHLRVTFNVNIGQPRADRHFAKADGIKFKLDGAQIGFYVKDGFFRQAGGGFDGGNAVSFGAGFSYLNVSESLPYGRSILKPYSGFGFSFDAGYHFNSSFDLNVKYRYLYCSFTGSFSNLIVQDIELAPSYALVSPWALDMCISLPLTMSIKADSVSFRAGLSILVALDSRRIRRVE